MIEAADLDEALRLASEASRSCRRAIEVRPMHGPIRDLGVPGRDRRRRAVARVHREEWARVVASPARRFWSLDLAEEMAAEAFATAVERWPRDGSRRAPAPGS